jgi:hypothetical protein
VLTWVTQALRESHRDKRKCHEEAIAKLQGEHRRIQDRIDAMYMDKLDGRIDNGFFDRKAAEFRSDQCRVMRDIETHQNANQSYIEEGIRLLDLARRAHVLFENQPPAEKRKLLDFVLSNCRWKAGRLEAEYRKPFDMLAVVVAAQNAAEAGLSTKWGKMRIGSPSWTPLNFNKPPQPAGKASSRLWPNVGLPDIAVSEALQVRQQIFPGTLPKNQFRCCRSCPPGPYSVFCTPERNHWVAK